MTGLLSSMSDELATDEEVVLLERLREELALDLAAVPSYPDVVGDIRLLRTLRGFDHSVADAAAAFRAHLAVRHSRNLDEVRASILEDWGGRLWDLRCEDAPHGELISSYMPEVLIFARTQRGDPIGLGLWGKGRPHAFVAEVEDWEAKFSRYYCYMNEARMLLLDQASREQRRLVHFIQVFDLEKWTIMGNSDRAWSSFTADVCRPVGETYHDCNSVFVAVRTAHWARMAYNVIKPALPKKVVEKILVFGEDFAWSREMAALVNASTIQRLSSRNYEPPSRVQEGRTVMKPKQMFELQVEVPQGAALKWKFGIEVDGWWLWRASCFGGPSEWVSIDLLFSLSVPQCRNSDSQGGAPAEWEEPQRVQGKSVRGRWSPPGGGQDMGEQQAGRVNTVTMRWENRNSLLTTKHLCYRVEVDLPRPEGSAASAVRLHGRRGPRGWWKNPRHVLAILIACVAILLGILLTSWLRAI